MFEITVTFEQISQHFPDATSIRDQYSSSSSTVRFATVPVNGGRDIRVTGSCV